MRGIGLDIAALSALWIAAAAVGLIVLLVCVIAIRAPRSNAGASVVRIAFFILAVVVFGSLARAYFDSAALRGQDADRQTLALRAAQLSTLALAPGSPLACLEDIAGDAVAAGCEKAVFASATSVASASAYVAARFLLLSDMTAFTGRGGTGIDTAMAPLRRALAADPFGLLAEVLQNRDGCTTDDCAALKVFQDPSRVRKNLKLHAFDGYVEQYRQAWLKGFEPSVTGAFDGRPVASTERNMPGGHRTMVNIDFPTASSIPPISIMNPEPARAAVTPREATGSVNPGHKPAAPSGAAAADPIWTPGR